MVKIKEVFSQIKKLISFRKEPISNITIQQPIKHTIKDRDTNICIKVCDVFEELNNAALIVPINTTFDTNVLGITEGIKSIQNQVVKKFYQNSSNLFAEAINQKLQHIRDKSTFVTDKPKNKYVYPIGTVIELRQQDNHFYLVTTSHINKDERAEGTKEEQEEALIHLWDYIKNKSTKTNLVIPLIGTGYARGNITREESVRLIIETFIKACSSKTFCDSLTIVIYHKDIEQYKINLKELSSFLEMQCKFPKFTESNNCKSNTLIPGATNNINMSETTNTKTYPDIKELELTIGVKPKDKESFDWNNLKESLKNTYGGHISEKTENQDLFSFSWSQIDQTKTLAYIAIQDSIATLSRSDIFRFLANSLNKHIASAGNGTLIEITQEKECVYQFIPKINFKDIDLESIGLAETTEIKQFINIIIVTVNEWEKKAVLELMDPWPKKDKILQGAISKHTYNFGKLGNYNAAHVEVEMGPSETFGTHNVLRTAVDELKPKVVLLLGLAFGFDNKKYRFGDVLVARTIQPCDYGKLESSGDMSFRGIPKECGQLLADRVKAHSQTWKYNWIEDIKGKKVQTPQGVVLSGEKVINNKVFRDKLYKSFEEFRPIGGEMEGKAAYSLLNYLNKTVEVILIKGICDWADGDKNDDAQPFAAFTAVSLAKHVLSKPDVLDPLIPTTENPL